MKPSDLRRLSAAGLDAEQIALVMEIMDEEAEERRAKGRARWRKHQENKKNANVSSLQPTFTANSRDRVTRVEDKTSTQKIEPQEFKKEEEGQNALRAPSPDVQSAVEAYAEMAGRAGLALPRVLTAARKAHLGTILREHGPETWGEALRKVEASAFCRGQNERGWKADLDFLLQPKSFAKILEGAYDDRAAMPRAGPQAVPSQADVFRIIARQEAARNGQEREDRPSTRPAIPHLSAVGE